MKYQDYDLWIDDKKKKGYPVRAQSDQGAVNGLLTLTKELQTYMKQLEEGKKTKKISRAFLRKFGSCLYKQLFSSKKIKTHPPVSLETHFQTSLSAIWKQKNQGLRIRLHIKPPKVSAIPWEFLYDPTHDRFLATSARTTLTRHPDIFQPVERLRVSLPLRVLVVVPRSGLNFWDEIAALREVQKRLKKVVEFEYFGGEEKVTRTTLPDKLLKKKYHVFHFIGHGGFDGHQGYVLIDHETQKEDYVKEEDFPSLFAGLDSMKLIVLNSCKGAKVSESKAMVGMALKLVGQGIPAVVAHQYTVSDDEAIVFAGAFYRSLCRGSKPTKVEPGQVEAAIAHARNRLSFTVSNKRALGTPVLFLTAPEGKIFDIKTSPQKKQKTKGRIRASSKTRTLKARTPKRKKRIRKPKGKGRTAKPKPRA